MSYYEDDGEKDDLICPYNCIEVMNASYAKKDIFDLADRIMVQLKINHYLEKKEYENLVEMSYQMLKIIENLDSIKIKRR